MTYADTHVADVPTQVAEETTKIRFTDEPEAWLHANLKYDAEDREEEWVAPPSHHEALRRWWISDDYEWSNFIPEICAGDTVEAWPVTVTDLAEAVVAVGRATSEVAVMGTWNGLRGVEGEEILDAGAWWLVSARRGSRRMPGEHVWMPRSDFGPHGDAGIAAAYVALGYAPPAALAARVAPFAWELAPEVVLGLRQSLNGVLGCLNLSNF